MTKLVETSSYIASGFGKKDDKPKSGKCSSKVAIFTAMLITSSTLSTTSFKMQGSKYGFKHGGFQVIQMFVGQWINLIFLFFLTLNSKRMKKDVEELSLEVETQKKTLKFSKLWMAITSLLDALGAVLSLTSLLLMPASMRTMITGGSIIFTTIVSRIMNKRLILRHHIVGCCCSLVGFVIVGYSGKLRIDDGSKEESDGIYLGIILNVFYMIISALQSNTQEIILKNKAINVQRMVGLEGIFGLIWGFILCVAFSFVPCPNSGVCNVEGYFDDIVMAIREIMDQPGLAVFVGLSIIGVLGLNLGAAVLIKEVSAVYRVFWGSLNLFSIWAVNVILKLEDFILIPAIVQLAGGLFLILGTFTYIEGIEWKFFGLNKDLQKYQNSKKLTIEEQVQEQFIPTGESSD